MRVRFRWSLLSISKPDLTQRPTACGTRVSLIRSVLMPFDTKTYTPRTDLAKVSIINLDTMMRYL